MQRIDEKVEEGMDKSRGGQIQVTQLGKAYKRYPTQKARLLEWILPFAGKRHTLNWVLQDINFSVEPGEAVGLIGINGAGKSTLLKIITGTTVPTTGHVEMHGTVAAMLELGMGFHPDFTGRQNVFMAGQLLGMQVPQITELFPAIEDFAEIGTYIDQPVRVYSSGMQMRLAFSVATALRPDILIVDEALSVGDTYFQHKSFDRIRRFRDLGTTLLLVSHDSAAIQSVCDRAVLLDNGKIVMQGVPDTVMDYYNAVIAKGTSHTTQQQPGLNGKVETVSGTGEAKIVEACLEDENGAKLKTLRVGQKTRLYVEIKLFSDIPELVFGYLIKDRLGQSVYGTNTYNLEKVLHDLKKGERIKFDVSFNANLGEGDYSISLALHTHYTHIMRNYQWKDLSVVFSVVNVENERFIGTCWLPPEIECSRQS